jgi:hypothetical protein
MAAKPVRTKALSRNASGSQLPSTAQAFTSANASAVSADKPAVIDTVKASPAPTGRAALRANLDAKPAAETRPKPGTVSAGERRPNMGGITPKPIAITAERETGSAEAGAAKKPAAKSAKKPTIASAPAKQASKAKPDTKAAASAPAKKADKPKRASAAE